MVDLVWSAMYLEFCPRVEFRENYLIWSVFHHIWVRVQLMVIVINFFVAVPCDAIMMS